MNRLPFDKLSDFIESSDESSEGVRRTSPDSTRSNLLLRAEKGVSKRQVSKVQRTKEPRMSQPLDTSRRNIAFAAHSDQGGRSDGAQVLVHKGHACIGHPFSKGFTVLDVRDPKDPRPVNFIPAPPNTWSLHLQAHEGLLLVINAADQFSASTYADESVYYTRPVGDTFQGKEREFVAGMRVFDISTPDQPREIGFMPIDGLGLHRMWYVGGRYAYVSAMLEGYTYGIFMVVDLADPTRPEPVGRWWIPGMWRDGGETPAWEPGRRYALHHPIVAGDTAFGAWRDGGLTLLDVSEPSTPRLLAHLNWCPPFGVAPTPPCRCRTEVSSSWRTRRWPTTARTR